MGAIRWDVSVNRVHEFIERSSRVNHTKKVEKHGVEVDLLPV